MFVCRKPITNVGDSTRRCYLQVNKHMQLPCCVILDQPLQKNGCSKPFPKVNLYQPPSSSNTCHHQIPGVPGWCESRFGLRLSWWCSLDSLRWPWQTEVWDRVLSKTMLGICVPEYDEYDMHPLQCRWKKGCIYKNKNTCTHQFHW